jgi:HEAT repeat protein
MWAIKNLVWKGTVINRVGWPTLVEALQDSDPGVQEQAFSTLRNVANSVPDVETALDALGAPLLLDPLAAALDGEFPAVQAQAAGLLANIANGPARAQDALLAHVRLPDVLKRCVADARPAVRHPAVAAAAALVHGGDIRRRRQLRELGLEAPLRALCDGAGAGARARSASVSGDVVYGSMMGVESDREVREKAKEALNILEHDIDVEMA